MHYRCAEPRRQKYQSTIVCNSLALEVITVSVNIRRESTGIQSFNTKYSTMEINTGKCHTGITHNDTVLHERRQIQNRYRKYWLNRENIE